MLSEDTGVSARILVRLQFVGTVFSITFRRDYLCKNVGWKNNLWRVVRIYLIVMIDIFTIIIYLIIIDICC